MARLFTRATPDFLHATTAAFTGPPFTISAWINSTDDTLAQSVVQIQNSAASNMRFNLVIATLDVFAQCTDAGGVSNAVINNVFTSNAWHHIGYVAASTTSRVAWYDGTASPTDTASKTPTGLDSTSIGMERDGTPSNAFSGQIEHVAIWNVALAAAEMQALSRRVSPLEIRPASRIHYWRIDGIESPEPAFISGSFPLTVNGTPTRANGSPIGLYSQRFRQRRIEIPASASLAAAQIYRRMLSG